MAEVELVEGPHAASSRTRHHPMRMALRENESGRLFIRSVSPYRKTTTVSPYLGVASYGRKPDVNLYRRFYVYIRTPFLKNHVASLEEESRESRILASISLTNEWKSDRLVPQAIS